MKTTWSLMLRITTGETGDTIDPLIYYTNNILFISLFYSSNTWVPPLGTVRSAMGVISHHPSSPLFSSLSLRERRDEIRGREERWGG